MSGAPPTGAPPSGAPPTELPGAGTSGLAIELDPAALRSDELRRVLEYWHGLSHDGRLPARKDIDPLDFPYLLGNVILCDVLREPLRFRYRLVGTLIAARLGMDLTGRLIEEHPHEHFRASVLDLCLRVLEIRRPLVIRRDRLIDGTVRNFESVLMPLADDGETIDMIFNAVWPSAR